MKLLLNTGVLGVRMAERGLDGESLALLADVSPSTVSSIFKGIPCHLRVGTAIAAALQSVPVLEGMSELLSNKDEGHQPTKETTMTIPTETEDVN